MAARRDPITAEDLRTEIEALDAYAYHLQSLRDRIDTSVGVLHDRVTADDMANVRAFIREAVALWDRISGIYESHSAAVLDVADSREITLAELTRAEERRHQPVSFRLPHVDAKETA